MERGKAQGIIALQHPLLNYVIMQIQKTAAEVKVQDTRFAQPQQILHGCGYKIVVTKEGYSLVLIELVQLSLSSILPCSVDYRVSSVLVWQLGRLHKRETTTSAGRIIFGG